jgi:hypothetical protein
VDGRAAPERFSGAADNAVVAGFDAAVVGTLLEAKGFEFRAVFLPDEHRPIGFQPGRTGGAPTAAAGFRTARESVPNDL